MSSDALPLRIGRYELLFEIGSGGMGKVFLARQLGDSGFERLVAVKRVHPHLVSDPDVYAMVSDEARIAALLRHPNVAPVIDVVDKGGELLLVLDYVEGFSLSTLLRAQKGPVPPGIASRVVIDALRGLHAAHTATDLLGESLELVHRDVSPQNLLIGSDGSTRVIDFGIARAKGNVQLTATGVIKGKVSYMAPERVENRDVDRRADVFAMGAVLVEVLTGRSPLGSGDESANLARAMLGEIDLEPVEAVAPKLAPVIARALARSPTDRYATADEMARALALAEPPEPPEEVAQWVERLKRAELDARRERTSEAIARSAAVEQDLEESAPATADRAADPENTDSDNAPSGLRAVEAGGADDSGSLALRSRSRSVWALGIAAVLAVNVGVWVAMLRTPQKTIHSQEDLPAARMDAEMDKATGAKAATNKIATDQASTSATPPAAAAAPTKIDATLATAPATGREAASSAGPVARPVVDLHSNPYRSH